jgi:lambda family phage portal protein
MSDLRRAVAAAAGVKPTRLDRFIAALSPERAMRRMAARGALAASMALVQGGGGGHVSGRSDRKSMQEYNPQLRSAEADTNPGLSKMRARSRDQVRNNPLAAGAVSTTVTTTVGPGLTVQPSIDANLLGLSDEQADEWERNALRVWKMWADSTECDVEDEITFNEMQDVVFRAVLESGDILKLRRFLWDHDANRPERGGVFATKLQLVEADRITNPDWKPDTTNLSAGVGRDDNGRVNAYHVMRTHPGDWRARAKQEWSSVPARDPKTGQRIAQLLFRKTRPGLNRGIPYLAPVIESLKQLERYSNAELMAAVVSAMFTVFVKSDIDPDDGGGLSPIDDGDGESAATAAANPGDLQMGIGSVVDLGAGDDVTFANPARPNAAFDPFVNSILRQVGVALELPFEVLIKHFDSSYSASRAALLEAWKFFRARRKWLVDKLCQPAYEDVIGEAVARGILEAPGFFDSPMVRAAWLGTIWTGEAMPQLDELKAANASKVRIDIGTSTVDRESRETNGSSFEGNHRQRRKEVQMRLDDGLSAAADGEAVSHETDKDTGLSKGTGKSLAPWVDPSAADLIPAETGAES